MTYRKFRSSLPGMTKLERLRIKTKLSVAGLASMAGVSDQTIRHMERGDYARKVQPRIRFGLCTALSCDENVLFTKEGYLR